MATASKAIDKAVQFLLRSSVNLTLQSPYFNNLELEVCSMLYHKVHQFSEVKPHFSLRHLDLYKKFQTITVTTMK